MRDDLVSWANAKYREFAVKMLDVLPDFPNCCYQVSGGGRYAGAWSLSAH